MQQQETTARSRFGYLCCGKTAGVFDKLCMGDSFTIRVIEALRSVPFGRVTTYGLIAAAAGNRRGARQVARILHSCSEKYGLPWHRVVNRNGEISVRSSVGYILQRGLLAEERVVIGADGRIDFAEFLWLPEDAPEGGSQPPSPV